jgi:hypothetical protein
LSIRISTGTTAISLIFTSTDCPAQNRSSVYLDLYPDDENADKRRRYCCTGEGLRRVLFSGEASRIRKSSKSGNIDFMRIEEGQGGAILTVTLFGGVIEAEAVDFQLAEVKA